MSVTVYLTYVPKLHVPMRVHTGGDNVGSTE